MGASLLSLLLLLLLLLVFPLPLPLFRSFTSSAAARAASSSTALVANGSNLLHLSAGLNISFSPASFNDTSDDPISLDLMFSVATPTFDRGGLFFPILSSPSFINTSPNISTVFLSFGYSLGFYLQPSPLPNEPFFQDARPCDSGCNLYMAVCAGSFGNISNKVSVDLGGALANDTEQVFPSKTVDGFAAPVWIANLKNPIRYVDRASLTVQELVADSNPSSTGALELHLRDGKNSVWRVPLRDADTMEMQDAGPLLIYNSASRSQPVWQSSPITDSLLPGQSLAVGKELVSNDSSYVARMEKGGLVFYMNKAHFNREAQPPPYWLFPLYRPGDGQQYKSLNQLISSAPCSNSTAHVTAVSARLDLYPGSCISNYTTHVSSWKGLSDDFSWMFWRLESDGMLHRYAISMSTVGTAASIGESSMDTISSVVSPNNPACSEVAGVQRANGMWTPRIVHARCRTCLLLLGRTCRL